MYFERRATQQTRPARPESRRELFPDTLLVEAFTHLPEWNGGDGPEAQTQALFAIATTDAVYPLGPAECAERLAGRACFRPEAARIIVLGTDAPFHEGPTGTNRYDWMGPPPLPVTFDQAIEAMHAIDAHVVGVFSGPAEYADDLRTTVTETGSVEVDGTPVFVEIPRNGRGVDDGLVSAVERYLTRVPIQVTLDVSVDVGEVLDVHPLAMSPFGPPRPLGSGFADVLPGTRLRFEIDVRVTPPTSLRVVTRANGREHLAVETLAIDVDDECTIRR